MHPALCGVRVEFERMNEVAGGAPRVSASVDGGLGIWVFGGGGGGGKRGGQVRDVVVWVLGWWWWCCDTCKGV